MSETTVYTPAPVSSRRLWYGVSAAAAAWVVHGLTSFVIADAACSSGRVAPWAGFTRGGLQTILIVLTVVMLAIAISGGVVAWRTWRLLATARFEETQAWGRGEFMALAGIFISTIFSLAIIWGGLGPILTGLCEATR